MDSRTVLIDPNSLPPRPVSHKLPRLGATRWVSRVGGKTVWTMVNPGLSRRHRRVAAVAYAPTNPRVFGLQIFLPLVVLVTVAAGLGWAFGQVFDNEHVPAWLVSIFFIGIGLLAGVLLLLTQRRQGLAQQPHVVQLRGEVAAALEEIEDEIAAYNQSCTQPGQRLPAAELLWNASFDEKDAIAIARSLAVLPPEEDVRVLDYLHSLSNEVRRGPGNVTTLQGMVRDPEA